jgi:sec-independent protein translocase protein TatB
MFDLDAGKLLVFGIVALAVIPPKDLPRVLRTVGQYVGKMRRMASEFQGQFMDAMKEAEKAADLESVKKEFHSIDEATRIDKSSFHPAAPMRGELPRPIEPPKSIESPHSSEPDKSTEPPHANGGQELVVAEAREIVPVPEPFSSDVVVNAPEVPEGPPPSAEFHAPSAP